MLFVTAPKKLVTGSTSLRSQLVLVKDNWDDFGFRTQFIVQYVDAEGVITNIGVTRVLDSTSSTTSLDEAFDSLENGRCSIGQSHDFYQNLEGCLGARRDAALRGLRDVAFDRSFARGLEQSPGFKLSLLRHAAAQQLFSQGMSLASPTELGNLAPFSFECQLAGFSAPHRIGLGFHTTPDLLNRIILLAGNNGTGKSGILSSLAYALSGENPDAGQFLPSRPLIRRTIVISYSVFQPFKSTSSNSDTYRYCGTNTTASSSASLQGSPVSFNQRFYEAAQHLESSDRATLWNAHWQRFCGMTSIKLVDPQSSIARMSALATVSSGHRIYIQIVQDLIRHLDHNSFVVLDEPELHLHPALAGELMRALAELLEKFRSYAVVATHSPVVLQEIPATHVRILARRGGHPVIATPSAETYGATLSELTDIGFRLSELDRNYLTHLKEAARTVSEEEIRRRFTEPLSLNLDRAIRSIFK